MADDWAAQAREDAEKIAVIKSAGRMRINCAFLQIRGRTINDSIVVGFLRVGNGWVGWTAERENE
jgi:hypothetical protein